MKKTLVFLVAVFMLAAFSVSAATFKVGEVYEYKSGAVADDIYIAGGTVDISGDVKGDGMFAGGEVSVLGDVTEDATVAGGTVRILGSVGDDMRIVGGNITVSSDVGGDMVVAGGMVRVLSDSRVGEDAIIAGGAVIMSGKIDGDLTVYGEDVMIDGQIDGDVVLKFTKKVTIGEGASIAGNLTYSSLEEVEIPGGVFVGGEVTRVELMSKKFEKEGLDRFVDFFILMKFLLMLVAGVLAVIVFKRFSKTVGVESYSHFWMHALIGFLALIVVPIAVVLLLATMLGAYIGIVLLVAYVLLLAIAKIYTGILAGALLSKWFKKEIIVDWKWTVLGITMLQALALIPVFGTLFGCLLVLVTFGTLLVLSYNKFWLTR